MGISVNPVFAARDILKSQISALYRGEETPIDGHPETALYLTTQKLDLDRMQIIAPGTICARLDGKSATIIRATGGFEEIVRSLENIAIPHELIRRDAPIPRNLAENEGGRLLLVARSIIHSALTHAEEVTEERREIENLQSLSNITARELLKGAVGRAYVYFRAYTRTNERGGETIPAWFDQRSGKSYFRLGAVIERFENGEIAAIAWLRENEGLFSEECKIPKAPGDDFRNLDYPLGGILRRLEKVFSSADKKARKNEAEARFELNFIQKMLEGSDEVFDANEWKPQFSPRQSVYVNIVAVDEDLGLFLLVHKYDDGKPSWGTAGGGVEAGETTEEGLIREVKDESGLLIYRGRLDGKLVGVDKVIERLVNENHKRITFYATFNKARFRFGRIKERSEIDCVGLFTLDEILRMPHYPYDRASADPNEANYIKQLHLDDIISVLRVLGKLEQFGCREATLDEYTKFVVERAISAPAAA